MKELFEFLFGAVLILILLIIVVYGILSFEWYMNEKACVIFAEKNNVEYYWSRYSNCLVLWDGKWLSPTHIHSTIIEDEQ